MKAQKKTRESISVLILIGTMGLLGLTGCSLSEEKSLRVNQAPRVVSAEFFPSKLKQGDAVVATAQSQDQERDAITYQYEWFVNKKLVHHERELPAHLLKRGDTVSVQIIPNDGYNDGPPFKTAASIVKNSPPKIVSIQLLPQPFRPGEAINAIVTGFDTEGDHIAYEYEWRKNGEPIFSKYGDKVTFEDLKKGDKITVLVTPHDGREAGKPFESLNLKSSNRRPSITSNPPHQFKNGIYFYPVKASDPDGDLLQYSIQDPQAGMVVDQKTGLFQWKIPDEISGVHHVTLVVRDAEGEGAAQKVRLDIDFLRGTS